MGVDKLLTLCEEAARIGGDVLQSWRGRAQVREKGPADLVTEADMASQEVIHNMILSAYPDHAFVGEEGVTERPPGATYCWIVDPLDGTTNYVHNMPHYCVSVGVELHGRPLAGAIYDPLEEVCYTASEGHGAFKNGQEIHVSQVTKVEEALLAVGFPAKIELHSVETSEFLRLAVACQAFRRLGSTALNLCYLAEGRLDGYFARSIYPWDVAAGVLLVREAGGLVTAPGGKPFDLWVPQLIAATGEPLHQALRKLLESC